MIAAITILIAISGAVLLLILFIRIRDTGKEFRLDQHRSKAMGFADLLVYAAVVEDGVIVGKNGSLMAAWVFFVAMIPPVVPRSSVSACHSVLTRLYPA